MPLLKKIYLPFFFSLIYSAKQNSLFAGSCVAAGKKNKLVKEKKKHSGMEIF